MLIATAVVANLCVLLLAAAKAFSILRTPINQPTAVQTSPTTEILQPATGYELSNNWGSEAYRKQKRQEARDREHALRAEKLSMEPDQILIIRIQSICNPSSMSAAEYE